MADCQQQEIEVLQRKVSELQQELKTEVKLSKGNVDAQVLIIESVHQPSFIHPFIHSFSHPFIHLFFQPFIYSSIYLSIHSFTHLFISNIHSLIHSLNHSLIHILSCWVALWSSLQLRVRGSYPARTDI